MICGPRTELRIVPDAETAGAPSEPGAPGLILVRGPQIMRGYLDRPQDTARVLRDGWLHTGDFGVLDARGRLTVLDRRTDLIVSGGENVYPSEIEAVLLEHPAVREAGVVARRDAEWGQRVEAVVVCEPQDQTLLRSSLLEHCAQRLARFKHPRAIHFASALPRTASGKLQRAALREALERESP
jgi:o-succinylbenzoate---CoA ligase